MITQRELFRKHSGAVGPARARRSRPGYSLKIRHAREVSKIRRHSQHHPLYPDWVDPGVPEEAIPRISGSAMPGGVFMSTGNARSAGDLVLLGTGMSIATLGALGLVLTFAISWVLQQVYGIPFAHVLLMFQTRVDPDVGPWVDVGLNLIMLFSFLVLMRISPLSGYHAAEHKVIGAIEQFGEPKLEYAQMMPRAHRRCGSNLLAGVLPLLLLAEPLWRVSPLLSMAVVFFGWMFRFHLGYLIQAIFATKEPSARQMEAGLEAGKRILKRWREGAGERIPPLVVFWRRGLAQMFAGMLVAFWLFSQLYGQLHILLDF